MDALTAIYFTIPLLLVRPAQAYPGSKCYNSGGDRIHCPQSKGQSIAAGVIVGVIVLFFICGCAWSWHKTRNRIRARPVVRSRGAEEQQIHVQPQGMSQYGQEPSNEALIEPPTYDSVEPIGDHAPNYPPPNYPPPNYPPALHAA